MVDLELKESPKNRIQTQHDESCESETRQSVASAGVVRRCSTQKPGVWSRVGCADPLDGRKCSMGAAGLLQLGIRPGCLGIEGAGGF